MFVLQKVTHFFIIFLEKIIFILNKREKRKKEKDEKVPVSSIP